MKSILKGKILSVEKIDGGAKAKMFVTADGKVDSSSMAVKHDIAFTGSITMKGLVADEMKIGAILTFTITDEEV